MTAARMLRVIAVVLTLAGVVVLGCVQLASSAAYGDLAVRPSLPSALHAAAPSLLRPLLGGRFARAQAAVHNGELDDAGKLLRGLPDGAAVADLNGRVAEARGRRDVAAVDYVRAGDAVRAQPIIDAIAVTDLTRAMRLQDALARQLTSDPAAGEVAGQAYWRDGQLAAAAAAEAQSARAASDDGRRAENLYERALSYAPNEETYLLAAGYQSLANGDAAASSRWYAHAAEVVPNSADAFAGLAWSSAARGDCPTARIELARSRALRTTVVPDPADDPRVGVPLHRCTQ